MKCNKWDVLKQANLLLIFFGEDLAPFWNVVLYSKCQSFFAQCSNDVEHADHSALIKSLLVIYYVSIVHMTGYSYQNLDLNKLKGIVHFLIY